MDKIPKEDRIKDSERTMIGVLKCECGNKSYAGKSGYNNAIFVKAAKDKICRPASLGSEGIGENIEARFGERARESVFRRIEKKRMSEAKKESTKFHDIGSCAAPELLVLCFDDGGYPKELTERWYSSDGSPTAGKYHYKEIGENGKTFNVPPRRFEAGESVPPCGTCEMLLPLLMCPEPGEAKCSH